MLSGHHRFLRWTIEGRQLSPSQVEYQFAWQSPCCEFIVLFWVHLLHWPIPCPLLDFWYLFMFLQENTFCCIVWWKICIGRLYALLLYNMLPNVSRIMCDILTLLDIVIFLWLYYKLLLSISDFVYLFAIYLYFDMTIWWSFVLINILICISYLRNNLMRNSKSIDIV